MRAGLRREALRDWHNRRFGMVLLPVVILIGLVVARISQLES
jgi:hypothetical protein